MDSVEGPEASERELGPGEAHVWTLPLALEPHALAKLWNLLSSDEQLRASRFRFDLHRNRFIAGRGLLRIVLGAYCGNAPARLLFHYGPNGKPQLPAQRLHFNLAHSEDVGVLAISEAGPVGVDIEHVRTLPEFDELVSRFFCTHEAEQFSALPEEQQPDAFFNLWTRKEALLKATGEGIGESLNKVEVSFLPGDPARIIAVPPERWASQEWSFVELRVPLPCVATLAIPGQAAVSQFQIENSQ